VPEHGQVTAKHLRDVPLTGMNMVITHAAAKGFTPGDPKWINLGQGQPEIGDIPGAPRRITQIALEMGDHAYGPVNGVAELREAVVAHYNRLYRGGRADYRAANVAIVAGGRPALNRAVAALGHIDVGYVRPDYAAYEDILDRNAPRIRPIGVATSRPGPADLVAAVSRSDLRALLVSNPRNPTGEVFAGDELRALVDASASGGRALLVDEFYSQYIYRTGPDGRTLPADGGVSAAAFVVDPERDPVLIFDGLTKNFRYPGWRLGWILGPTETIATIERVGQAMDGGASQVVQRAALGALEPGYADAETTAVRNHFAAKRDVMVDGLRAARIAVPTMHPRPYGTFYAWGSLAELPAPLRDGDAFFFAALEHHVVTVPGRAFDLNPGNHRHDGGAFDGYVRFSFGPSIGTVAEGVERIRTMVDGYR
jgi:hypothetical protein